MPTWRNFGWLNEPLQNWAVKSPSPRRDIRRHCIVWSRDELEKQREVFERAGRAAGPAAQPARPQPTPRHRRYAAPIDPAHARYLPPGTVSPIAAPAAAPSAAAPHAHPQAAHPHGAHAHAPHPQAAHPHAAHAPRPHAGRPLEITASWATPSSPASVAPASTLGALELSTRDLVVGLLLVLLPPLGVLLLWSGSRPRETKVVSTVVAMMWMTAVTVVTLAGILA